MPDLASSAFLSSVLQVFTALSALPLLCGYCGDDITCLNFHSSEKQ